MMAEEREAPPPGACAAAACPPATHSPSHPPTHSPTRSYVTAADAEKRELVDKLRQAVAAGKAVRAQAARQDEQLRRQLEAKDAQLQVAASKLEAFQLELRAQAQQAETRALVLQQENGRLAAQLAAALEQQQQREAQLSADARALQSRVDDLAAQLAAARQQQHDTEAMDGEVAAELNRVDELQQADGRRLARQVETLTAANDAAAAELARTAQLREKLLVHAGIDLSFESIASLLDTKNREIHMLTEQLAAADAPQEEAVRHAVAAALADADALRGQCAALAADKVRADKAADALRAELQRVAQEHAAALSASEEQHRQAYELLQNQQADCRAQLQDSRALEQQLLEDFGTVKSKIEALVATLHVDTPEPVPKDGEHHHHSRMSELESYLECIQEHLVEAGKPDVKLLQSNVEDLQDRIRAYETETQQLADKLQECERELKARASEIEQLAARKLDGLSDTDKCVTSGEDTASNGETAESCNGHASDPERELQATKAHLHAIEAEMAACKAENLRMIFEVAKTADGVSKLKQDHEALLVVHQEKSLELDAALEQLQSLEASNNMLESDLKRASDDLRCHLEAFAMQKEDFESVIADLDKTVNKTEKENFKIKLDLEDIKNENDVLEERISELHAVADSKTEPDELQEKDREVEELRSSLVQAKVDFLEQKQQLTALEKKLVAVSKSSGPACTINNATLDAERREFEAALIEMIEMEKKLQVAYEAKQSLESTLQERMEAKNELEHRLSIAEDKIAELEQQLEQKVALIATIEKQLRSVEEEREKLSDEFAKTKSKLERSRGKLEEKAIEFEAFKTTTNMLKDERSRLFNEIALLKDKIAKSEVQKAAMADSQELANEELEEQLNELADKIAEIEAEKQDLRARLEDTIYRSEEDIHQLRERLYMLEEEKSGLDDENYKLERMIETLETKLDTLEVQKTHLEEANASTSEQLSLLEDRVKNATSEIATLSAEKDNLIDLQQSLEDNVTSLQHDKTKLERTLEETTAKLHEELEQVTAQVEALQIQLSQNAAEKEKVYAELSELQERAEADKLAHKDIVSKLEAQVSENGTLENKIAVLKQMAEKALLSLQVSRDELSQAESRAVLLVEERDTVKSLLQEKESENEAVVAQREHLQHQVEKLTSELTNLQLAHSKEVVASQEVITGLKHAEAKLMESLESVKRDLAEAESCVMVLVEERDAARRDLTARDLKIEMLTTQQGELDLAAQKFETELNTLRSKTSTEAEATEETIRNLQEAKAEAEETARNLNDLSTQAKEELTVIREQLAESELRVAALEKERDVTRTSLDEKLSTHETLSALQEDLQNKVTALETELKEQREKSSAELVAAHETIMNLKEAEAKEAEASESLRQELAEAEGCVMVLVEERDAAKKTLSKRDLTLEVLSSEHGELQLKSQSVTTELEALRSKSVADGQAAEEMIQSLKEDVKRVTESLESATTELSEFESRMASLTAERDTVTEALGKLDAEHISLSSQNEEQLLRIKGLEGEIVGLQTQQSTELAAAEDTILSLKSSITDINNTLESVRQDLSDSQVREATLTEGCDSTKLALNRAARPA
ncbi:unnamed protein product [Phytophthora fragariaefolia]|uniref:Unnamed protein product n=1 Tax=Phytophthora fragariaefolia TaxID=1490495 RepID=A0A9W6U8W0_9STRA|nr:unnamed protein product [Phytophthora fragariaefolia]